MSETRVLLDPRQVAARLGVTPGALAKWRISGDGPPFLKLGARVRYTEADVSEWVTSRRRRSTADGERRGAA